MVTPLAYFLPCLQFIQAPLQRHLRRLQRVAAQYQPQRRILAQRGIDDDRSALGRITKLIMLHCLFSIMLRQRIIIKNPHLALFQFAVIKCRAESARLHEHDAYA